MKIDISRFRQTFFQEAFDHVDSMEAGLLALDSGPADPEALNAIFRAAHSIKGASGTFGFEDVGRFTHAMESLLDRMRQGQVDCSSARVQVLLKASDMLRVLLTAADSGAPAPPEAETLLASVTVAQRSGEFEAEGQHQTRERDRAQDQGSKTYLIHFTPSPEVFRQGMDPLLILRELSELGAADPVTLDSSRIPSLQELEPDTCYLSWDIRLQTARSRSEIEDVFAFVEDGAQIEVKLDEPQSNSQGSTRPAEGAQTTSVRRETRQLRDSASIRVATEKVDSLINLVGELVIAQSMAVEIVNHFSVERLPELQAALIEVTRNTRDLQERVMGIRMLPVGTIFARLPRIAYDVATATGKSINVEMSGEESELDKGLLEGMVDPLTHLIRNAADHGIESPEVRTAAGKPERGTIRLQARHESGNFVIEISDDGKGLDVERIRQKAIERGLLTGTEELAPEQIQEFIFHPGFSTAEKVSEVSGRGVGMDVVRKNVEALGGAVSLKSEQGQGTTIRIKLPLTLAILDGQLVRVGDQTYVLPLVSIIESIRPSPEQVRPVAGQGEVVVVRQEPLPLLRLHELFGVSTEILDPSRGLVAVVEHGNRRLALLVDELLSQQQVVIKNLEANFRKVEGAMGATILGDGRVSFILDIAGIVDLWQKGTGTATKVLGRAASVGSLEVIS